MIRREEIITEAKKHECDWGIDVDRFDVPDIFTKGAEWADKTMIEKACQWLQEEVLNAYKGVVWEQIIEDFRKAMEE